MPEVTELAWILATVTGMGLLERAISYKDKVDKGIEASVGLFTYPVLMAADILIYRSHLVPVGKDQVQHLEMTRDMAGYFNQRLRRGLPAAGRSGSTRRPKVPGTDGQKMSKSYGNTIEIFAEGKPLKKTVMGIVTDSTPVEAAEGPGDVQRLRPVQPVRHRRRRRRRWPARYRAGGMGYGDAKKMLLAKIDAYFGPAREQRKELAADPEHVEDVLRQGRAAARAEAQKTMALVREAVGMRAAPVS